MTAKIFSLMVVLAFAWNISAKAQETDKRTLPPFTEISLRVSGDVHLMQGDNQSVEIKAKASTINKLITEVKDRKLVIRFSTTDSWFKSWNPGKIDIYITIPQIDALSVSGSGSILSDDEITSRILDLAVSGSGDIKLTDLSAEKVSAAVSGSGDIYLEGSDTSDSFEAAISGSGDIKASELKAKNVDVKISGSGDCDVYAVDQLKVRVIGSGTVRYDGNPQIDSNVSGSGGFKKGR
ncbi:head GIN domain-containing protein [Prolixibacter denitrificans]|uniref:DUF2807 domain-containing protein n=1 Tax=Prolixibacter denitrificans TaxID=1541063 RepID=A0A2P8CKU8_9BACT|nr:head GIN domain-containing protein [Prolixibacter denitrificans]PSK85597.1 putative autotransporter adhesin-like protein [Prolixibacter denitrificans]GET20217.1 DUF2807 domain-containing protein [Prolixibacter denitrificans]